MNIYIYIYIYLWARPAPWTAPIQVRPRGETNSYPGLSKIHSALCKHVKPSKTKENQRHL